MLHGLLYPCTRQCNANFSATTQIQNSRQQHCLLHCLSYRVINRVIPILLLLHVCLSNSQPRTFAGVPALFLWESPPYHHSIAGVPAILFFFLRESPPHNLFQLRESPPHLFFKCRSPRPRVALISIFVKI